MADLYSNVTVANYNLNPPPDDGSASAANEIKWANHKSKLGDPLKTAIEAINTNIQTALGKTLSGGSIVDDGSGGSYTASVQGKIVRATSSSITITTPDATSVLSPFVWGVLNDSGGTITIDGSGTQTINGNATITIQDQTGLVLFSDGSNWFALGRNDIPDGGINSAQLASAAVTGAKLAAGVATGQLFGLTLSNNASDATNDIDIAAGSARDSTDAETMVLAAGITKRLDAAWAVGTGNGGLDTGSIANTTYHIWLIERSDTGVVDVLFSASASSPTLPTNYDRKRRIGSIVRSGGAILAFVQNGDDFHWVTPVTDLNTTYTTSQNVSLSLTVPVGIKVKATIVTGIAEILGSGNITAAISALDTTSLSVVDYADFTFASGGPEELSNMGESHDAGAWRNAVIDVWTNTSGQVRLRTTNGNSALVVIRTHSWIDTRGRLA